MLIITIFAIILFHPLLSVYVMTVSESALSSLKLTTKGEFHGGFNILPRGSWMLKLASETQYWITRQASEDVNINIVPVSSEANVSLEVFANIVLSHFKAT